jgi:hypothetical protein
MKSRPYALTEWLDSSASQIQGTSAMAVADPSPVASRARARKASTLSAAGARIERLVPLHPDRDGGETQDQKAHSSEHHGHRDHPEYGVLLLFSTLDGRCRGELGGPAANRLQNVT